MRKICRWVFGLFMLAVCLLSFAAETSPVMPPGLLPYVPNRIEWLALSCNAELRHEATVESPFDLHVVRADHETLMIFVLYHPNVDRQIMNSAIDTARQVIMITAKSYRWDKWLKLTERVEMHKF
jgi:hypothetical protein